VIALSVSSHLAIASSTFPDATSEVRDSAKMLILKRISRKMENFTATMAMKPMEQRSMGIIVKPPLDRNSSQDIFLAAVTSCTNGGCSGGVVVVGDKVSSVSPAGSSLGVSWAETAIERNRIMIIE
jgi:hypothetical protein